MIARRVFFMRPYVSRSGARGAGLLHRILELHLLIGGELGLAGREVGRGLRAVDHFLRPAILRAARRDQRAGLLADLARDPLDVGVGVVGHALDRGRLHDARDAALAPGPLPGQIVVVDDRCSAAAGAPLPLGTPSLTVADRLVVVAGRAAGPAAARNVGWRTARAAWIAFLDDDVLPPAGWAAGLGSDLAAAAEDVGGIQGRVQVPLPAGRPPTDWERNVAGLGRAAWATADMAYRRATLVAVDGFDERFPRAYREDADLALRVHGAGWRLVRGERSVAHPVRPADPWVGVRLQAGNADDALMLALHGRDWREKAGAPPGRKRRHLAVTAAAVGAVAGLAARRPAVFALAAAGWLAGTAELAWARIAPGPRTGDEVATMLVTSAALAPAATAWSVAGALRWRRLLLARALGTAA